MGTLPADSAGEWITAEGVMVQDKELRRLQLRAAILNTVSSPTAEGSERYMGSVWRRAWTQSSSVV